MKGEKRVWNSISLALTIYMLVLIWLLLSMVSCQRKGLLPSREQVEVVYETDDQDSIDWQIEVGSQEAVATKAKLTLMYIDRETDLFRPSTYTVKFWNFGYGEPIADKALIVAEGKYAKPTYTISKPNNFLAYTRLTLTPGWYLAEFGESGMIYKFKATATSDGLLIVNECPVETPLLAGYYPAYGRIRFSFGKQNGIGARACLNLSREDATQAFRLYAEEGVTRAKSMDWFMPTGIYSGDWYKAGTAAYKTSIVTIAPGKRYPNLNL